MERLSGKSYPLLPNRQSMISQVLLASPQYFQRLGVPLSPSEEARLVDGYAAQLIGHGQWELAVYVLLCTLEEPTDTVKVWRQKLAKSVVLQNYGPGMDSIGTFLKERIGIPPEWLEEALADRYAHSGNMYEFIKRLSGVSNEKAGRAVEDLLVPSMLFRSGREAAKALEFLREFTTDENSLGGVVVQMFELKEDIVDLSVASTTERTAALPELRDRAHELERNLNLAKAKEQGMTRPSVPLYGFRGPVTVPMSSFLAEALSVMNFLNLQIQALEDGKSIWEDEFESTEAPVPMKVATQLVSSLTNIRSSTIQNIDLKGFGY